MPPNKLDVVIKARILSKIEDGWSIRAVAEHFNINKNTVFYVKKRWEQQQTLLRKVGSGRRRVSTLEEDAAFLNMLRENPFSSAVVARIQTNFPGSPATASRRVKSSELKYRVAANKPFLSEEHKQSRIIFSLNYVYRDLDYWNSVVFTDEKVFQSSKNSKIGVYRPANTKFTEKYTNNLKTSGRFSVNVWGWISGRGGGVCWRIYDRFNAPHYLNILENIMLPSVTQLYPNNFIYQHDNCPVHTAAAVGEWFRNHNIEVLPWPANSPDINPIENMWGLIVKKLYQRNFYPQNAEELWAAIQGMWEEISGDENCVRELISSMPRRLDKVILSNGGPVKY